MIIDTPPGLNAMVKNALSATSNLIIPVNGYLSMKNIAPFIDIVIKPATEINPGLIIDSIITTFDEPRTNISKKIRTYIRQVNMIRDIYFHISLP